MGQKRPVFIQKRLFLGLQHNSRNLSKFDHFGPQKGRWARSGPFPLKNGLFLSSEIRCKFDHFGPQKGRWARSGPFPLKNGLFLSSEIRCKFDHFGPQKGRWARNGPFPLQNGLFLVYSTIAEFDANLTISGPKRADGPETARFHCKTAFSWSIAQ